MSSSNFLFSNGVILHPSDAPPVSTFLESHPGAYTTTRTHNNASFLLFWDRHLQRLANSARILFESKPEFLFESSKSSFSLPSLPATSSSKWDSTVRSLVNDALSEVVPVALGEKRVGEEWAVTTLVTGNLEKLKEIDCVGGDGFSALLDVRVHVQPYVLPAFGFGVNGAHLAVVGRGRDVAAAKYSNWVRLRKGLEKLRPPSVTELLLSNDGDQLLEGSITNFFVVCRKDKSESKGNDLHDHGGAYSVEVQTAPIGDGGVLKGVIRQLVIEVCLSKGIPVREVAPSWAKRELWEEAFITSSLRVLQHVETVKVPSFWESLESKSWGEISWNEKRFKEGPGMITKIIQEEIMVRAHLEGFPLSKFI
ncbi:hypothetical protein SLE2022_069220 [Rubroshorea leprosula]